MDRSNLSKWLFLTAAGISFIFSVSLWFSGQREEGVFVATWVPSILAVACLTFITARQLQ